MTGESVSSGFAEVEHWTYEVESPFRPPADIAAIASRTEVDEAQVEETQWEYRWMADELGDAEDSQYREIDSEDASPGFALPEQAEELELVDPTAEYSAEALGDLETAEVPYAEVTAEGADSEEASPGFALPEQAEEFELVDPTAEYSAEALGDLETAEVPYAEVVGEYALEEQWVAPGEQLDGSEALDGEFTPDNLDSTLLGYEDERPVQESAVGTLETLIEAETGAGSSLADRVRGMATFVFGPTLRRGSRGPAVATLQRALRSLGYDVVADGDFGPATERAVRAAQSRLGLQVDGIVGPRTKSGIVAALPGSGRADGHVRVALGGVGGAPLKQACGFFDPAGGSMRTEAGVRNAIVATTLNEVANWRTAANFLRENAAPQFGFLVSYALGASGTIFPTTLAHLQARAVDTVAPINYRRLPAPAATLAQAGADAALVAADLLVGAPPAAGPPNLNRQIQLALMFAHRCILPEIIANPAPPPAQIINGESRFWSAVFVSDCVRRAGIQEGLETALAGNHEGINALLQGSTRHWEYTLAAVERRRNRAAMAPGDRDSTYQAFEPREEAVELGDIIVEDRRGNLPEANVRRFADIRDFGRIGPSLHGDIVVERSGRDVVTLGGNIGDSVKRRRWPVGADGRLIVAANRVFTEERVAGGLIQPPAAPGVVAVGPGASLPSKSTRRVFALLRPVPRCVIIPGQQVEGGVLA